MLTENISSSLFDYDDDDGDDDCADNTSSISVEKSRHNWKDSKQDNKAENLIFLKIYSRQFYKSTNSMISILMQIFNIQFS